MNKERRNISLGLGVPTILAVFIILCMCILSVLTYMNASHNHASWKKEKANIVSYYEADTKAKQIVNALRNQEDMAFIEEKYDVNFKKEETNIVFQVIMKDRKYLSVSMDENLNILAWKRIKEE